MSSEHASVARTLFTDPRKQAPRLLREIDKDGRGVGKARRGRRQTGGVLEVLYAAGLNKIYREGKKVLMNILDIEVPMIAALNGPVRLHSE